MRAPAGPPPVITSVVANRGPDQRVSEIFIKWNDSQHIDWEYVDRYAFFFGFQTNGQSCISAGSQTKNVAGTGDNGAFSATLQHVLDPFVRYTVQVAQDTSGLGIGPKSEAFEFTLNASRK